MIRYRFGRNIKAHLESIGMTLIQCIAVPIALQSSIHPLQIVAELNCRCVLELKGFLLVEGKIVLCNFHCSFKQLRLKFRLCSKHRKIMSITEDFHLISMESNWSNGSQSMNEYTRDTIKRVLTEARISQIQSQTRTTPQHQSKSSLRRLFSKLNLGTASLRGMMYSSVMFSQHYDV